MQEMQETRVRFLGREDPLEEGIATHSSVLRQIPWSVEPGGLQSVGSQRVAHDWRTEHNGWNNLSEINDRHIFHADFI